MDKTTKIKLLSNFGSLGLIRVAQYLIPLITIPYLARVIGVEGIGKVAFAQAIVGYFSLVPDLGLPLYAITKISAHQDEQQKISMLVSNILALKIVAFMIVYLIFLIVLFSTERFSNDRLLYLFASMTICSNAIFPDWFFQGIQRMWHIAIANFIGAVISMLCIFIFIHKQGDYYLVPALYALSSFTAIIYMYYVINKFPFSIINLSLIKINRMAHIAKEAFPLFVSRVSISIYTGIYTVVLGFLTNYTVVGYYTAAERLIKACLNMQSILGQVYLPHMSSLVKQGKMIMMKSLKQVSLITILISMTGTLVIFIFSGLIINIFYGADFVRSILPLRVMSFLFVIIGMSNIMGMQILLPLGKRKQLSYPIVVAGVLSVLSLFFLAPAYLETGAALSFIISELTVTSLQFVYLYRHWNTIFLDGEHTRN